jgi:hypothetical protein
MERGQSSSSVNTESTAAARAVEDEPFRDGFNLKSICGGLFLAFVMLPGSIYLSLVTGDAGSMQTAGQWVTVILFAEIARRTFTRLTRQEIIILHMLGAGLVVAGGPFFSLIRNQYLIQSVYADKFGLVGELSLPENAWISPAPGSEALATRSLLHGDFVPALLVIILAGALGRAGAFTFGYALFRITSDVEKLPFPMAPIAAQGAAALADSFEEEGTWRWRVFSTGVAIGIVFGTIYVVVPTVTGGIMGRPLSLLPIPWIDWTPSLGRILPGAMLGLGTSLAAVFVGFVLPYPLVKGQFLSSCLCFLVMSPLLLYAGILHSWKPGMGAIATQVAHSVDFWMSFNVGVSLLIAALGIWLAGRTLLGRRGERLSLLPPPGRGDFSMGLALGVWLLTTLATVYLCHRLVPAFPWWIFAVYGLVWTPLNSYISARLIGLTGSGIGVPFLREGSFVLSTRYLGYEGASIWFAPIPLADYGGGAQSFRELELTRTKLSSVIKAQLFMYPLLLVAGLTFCAFLWKMGPIPSAAYPFAAKMWPLEVYHQCLWVTATRSGESLILSVLRWDHIVLGFGVGLGVYVLCRLIRAPILLFYGLLGGAGVWPHTSIPMFAGALLSRFVLAPRYGEKAWSEYAPVLTAGTICGIGLAGMIAIGFTLTANAVIQLPY